jgi:hypothetical protein
LPENKNRKEDTMVKFKWLVVLAWILIVVQPSFADDSAKVLGIWRLVSFEREYKATGEKEPLLGKNPTGYIFFTPEGRFMAILTGEGRKAPQTDQDRANLLKSMFAYTGMYRLEADKFITKVDVSWNPEWIDTEQERFFRFDGERLQILTMWLISPNWPEKGMGRGVLTFERAK